MLKMSAGPPAWIEQNSAAMPARKGGTAWQVQVQGDWLWC
jgi:hypothetical protein